MGFEGRLELTETTGDVPDLSVNAGLVRFESCSCGGPVNSVLPDGLDQFTPMNVQEEEIPF